MAVKKTSMFTLTERVTISAPATDTFATIDLSSYVDVADRQAIQIHSVDYVFQGNTPAADVVGCIGNGHEVKVQLTDLNRQGLVFVNDRAIVSSGQLTIDANGGPFEAIDMYPDNYGKGSDDGRYVVNDQLYITANSTNVINPINVTVRVNASVVSLTAKDFMAIAIQSTAADN